jgi:flagellin-like hook-associated protein FlgL
MAFDKTEYTAGEKMVLTVTAVDSNGAGVADGARNLFTANTVATVNLIAVTTLPQISVTLLGGKATYTMYAPLATGPITVSGTEGSATDNVAAGGTAAAITASATVVSDGVAQAAADAAAEATDAANAATDAANAAAEAADAATAAAQDAADAVAALATQVATYISNLRKQITALTNLVIKIQKKVNA